MLATIYPDRITVRQSKPADIFAQYERNLERRERKLHPESIKNLSITKKDFTLSPATQRKIKDTFQLLFTITPPRKIEFKPKKYIYNFRLSFVTLTLPAPQRHADIEIKNRCLNNFLNIMRSRFDLKNYIWIAELQKNQNIHFHIVWDHYINHHAVRYYWNQSLELLGYVSEYSNKFKQMTLSQYASYRKTDISAVQQHFARSCRQNWKNPPTEQVVSIKSQKSLVSYLAKYITKNTASGENIDTDRINSFGRSWSRSQSLSAIKFITRWDWNSIKYHVERLQKSGNAIIKKTFDYCTVYYLNVQRSKSDLQKWITSHMLSLANSSGYIYPN